MKRPLSSLWSRHFGRSYRRGLALAALLLAQGCSSDGTKTGNGMRLDFSVAGESLLTRDAGQVDSLLHVVDSSGTRYDIGVAKLSLGKLELRADGFDPCPEPMPEQARCSKGRFTWDEAMVADLITRETSPDLSVYQFPVGRYDRVQVRIDPRPKSAPEGRVSLWVEGTAHWGGEERPFVLAIKRSETLRFEDVAGVLVEDEQWLSAELDLELWFAALPLTDCYEDGGLDEVAGAIRIDDTSRCSEVERALVDVLRSSTGLRRRVE